MRRVSVFGATGSIGQNTLDLLRRQGGADAFDVVALTCARNIWQLATDCREFQAGFAVVADDSAARELKDALADTSTQVLSGDAGLAEAAAAPVDWAMSAVVGAAGLRPTLQLARQGCVLALANKESLVCAGDILVSICARHGTRLLPVDSEHNAIFQVLEGQKATEIDRLILTSSGGPFRAWSREAMQDVTPAQAMAHPNFSMGSRISVDSANMFNKALEVIEAKHLFGVESEQVEVIVHPQQIVHSMAGFVDGSILAQLGPPDMRGAIGFALNWPERRKLPVERLDFAQVARLDFEDVDLARFPSLRLARTALEIGGTSGAVLNGAKEAALDAFLADRIGFLDMAEIVERVQDALGPRASTHSADDGVDTVFEMDKLARNLAQTTLQDRN